MSSSSFSPTGTPGISSTPYLHLSPISLAHIKGTDDWNGARWSVSGWKTVEITTHSYPFVKMTLFSRLLCFSRFFTHGEVERKAAASDVWKMPFSRGRDMVKEPLWWFSFLRFSLFSLTWTDCLRKAASSLSCFFLSTVHGKFSSENEPFSPSHLCMFTRMPSDIFIYTVSV